MADEKMLPESRQVALEQFLPIHGHVVHGIIHRE
jgi:hypothetical protein